MLAHIKYDLKLALHWISFNIYFLLKNVSSACLLWLHTITVFTLAFVCFLFLDFHIDLFFFSLIKYGFFFFVIGCFGFVFHFVLYSFFFSFAVVYFIFQLSWQRKVNSAFLIHIYRYLSANYLLSEYFLLRLLLFAFAQLNHIVENKDSSIQ